MSREDRRPLSQVPEDSVCAYMHSFTSQAPSQQELFTILHPPYNGREQHIFDTFAYFPSDTDHHFNDWAYSLPHDVQDVDEFGPDYPHLSVLQRLPFRMPVPQTPQPTVLLSDTCPERQALPTRPDSRSPYVLNPPELSAGFFPGNEYRDFPVPHLAPAPVFFVPAPAMFSAPQFVSAVEEPRILPPDVTESHRPPSFPAHHRSLRRSRAARAYPLPGPNGFVPSDPDDLSSHEKKRLYVESLERYIQYLHQLFAFLNIAPAPLQRVSNYRALTSRSMRTILLVLRRSAEAIHALTVEEASKSIHLREALLQAQAINSDRDQIFEIRETTVSPSSDSAGTSSTCVTAADPDATDISKYFADPSF